MGGTATGVGKTWVTCTLAAELGRRGHATVARKPAQSFDPEAGDRTDAHLLAEATGDSPLVVCPPQRWYPLAMAPPMAAGALGRPAFSTTELVVEMSWPPGTAIGLVEPVGGVRSPLAADGDTVALCTLLRPDLVIVVAGGGLGAINAVRLSVGAVAAAGAPVVVHLNRFDGRDRVHAANRDWLTQRDSFDVTVAISALADRVGR
ncbi:MAG: AAA family ATPase [Acidimicrobiales bacterium]